MRLLALAGALLSIPSLAAETRLEPLLKAVESRYNRAQSLRLRFSETLTLPRRPERVESGVLTLRKPGRMRWDYAQPSGKVFVSDGKRVSLYDPETNQVEISGLKETEDLRAPLAFLLGKLNFYKEFRSFSTRPDPNGTWISAAPNNDNLPYSRVEFLATEDGRIERLKILGQDRSVLDFRFEDERLNAPADLKLFVYRPPPSAQIIEGDR